MEVVGGTVADGIGGIVVVGGVDGEREVDNAVAAGDGAEAVDIVAGFVDGGVEEGVAVVAAGYSGGGSVVG